MKHIVSIIAIMITIPTIAMAVDVDIAPGDSATCDNTTLQSTGDAVNLRAEWTANTINLNYYSDNTQYTNNTCTYGGGITLPDAPSKTGYTFMGWRLTHICTSLSEFTPAGRGIRFGYKNDSTSYYGAYSSNADVFGLTEDNTWAVQFDEGVIKGRALCSSTYGPSGGGPGVPDPNTKYGNCWCVGTDFNDSCHILSVSKYYYIGNYNMDNRPAEKCANLCANACAQNVNVGSRGIFLLTQE